MSEKLSTTPILLLKFLIKLVYKENIVIGIKAEEIARLIQDPDLVTSEFRHEIDVEIVRVSVSSKEKHQKFPGLQDRLLKLTGEHPLLIIRERIREVCPAKIHRLRARIVELDPREKVPVGVGESGDVVDHRLIDPNRQSCRWRLRTGIPRTRLFGVGITGDAVTAAVTAAGENQERHAQHHGKNILAGKIHPSCPLARENGSLIRTPFTGITLWTGGRLPGDTVAGQPSNGF